MVIQQQTTATKSTYSNPMTQSSRGMPSYHDAGYTLDIPWNDVYTTGWMDGDPKHDTGKVWGTENQLATRRDPEYFAPDNIVRSNIIPIINLNNPIYSFDRSKFVYKVY